MEAIIIGTQCKRSKTACTLGSGMLYMVQRSLSKQRWSLMWNFVAEDECPL